MKKVFLFLALFAASAMVMTSCGGSETTAEATEDTAATEVKTEETTPVENVTTEATEETTEAEVAVLGDAVNGKKIYDLACTVCHATGVAGAAKLDDKARWEATAAQGLATVYDHAISGFTGAYGPMPAKGGNTTLTDQDVHDAVAYMFEQAGVEVK